MIRQILHSPAHVSIVVDTSNDTVVEVRVAIQMLGKIDESVSL